MSVLKNYIFQDCSDSRNVYELIFLSWTGSTGGIDGLDVGEIWEIEDSNGNNIEGCYSIIDSFTGDTYSGSTMGRFTGDTFSFGESVDCEVCLAFFDDTPSLLSIPTIDYYVAILTNCDGGLLANAYISQPYYDGQISGSSVNYTYTTESGACYEFNGVDPQSLTSGDDITSNDVIDEGGLETGNCNCGDGSDPSEGLSGGEGTTSLSCSFSVSANTISFCNFTGTTINVFDISANDGPHVFNLSNGDTIISQNGEDVEFTGITEGLYEITMISDGCIPSPTETINIVKLNTESSILFSRVQESECFDCNGSGLTEYYGFVEPINVDIYEGTSISVSNEFETMSGVTGGNFTITGLCTNQDYLVLITDSQGCTNKIVINVGGSEQVGSDFTANIVNTDCEENNGIQVFVTTNGENVIYFVSGDTEYYSAQTTSNSYTFNQLTGGTYQMGIITPEGCTGFTDTIELNLTQRYVIDELRRTEPTCGQSNGILTLALSGDNINLPIDVLLINNEDNEIVGQIIDTFNVNSVIFTNLYEGTYVVRIIENNGCEKEGYFSLIGTSGVVASIYGTNCQNSNIDGSAEIIVHSAEGEVEYLWSNGETGSTITNLSGGTYSVTLTDENGCQLYKEIEIICNSLIVSNLILNTICEQEFTTTYNQQKTFKELAIESCGGTNYVPSFKINFSITNIEGQPDIVSGYTFYTGNNINDVPTNKDWINEVQNILDSINTQYDFIANTSIIDSTHFNIDGVCNEPELENAIITLSLEIDCVEIPTPTPTNTPTITMTPTITQTPTPTNDDTPLNVYCDDETDTWLSGWIIETFDGSPQNGRFQVKLIETLPENLPDPNNITNPINYGQILISRYDQGSLDFGSNFTSLNGSNGGTITLEFINGDLISYNITNIDYVFGSRLVVDLGDLVYSGLENYQYGDFTYGICIDAQILISSTPTVTNTPINTPTQTQTPSSTGEVQPDLFLNDYDFKESSPLSDGSVMFSIGGTISGTQQSLINATHVLIAIEDKLGVDRSSEWNGFSNIYLHIDADDGLSSCVLDITYLTDVVSSYSRFIINDIITQTNEPPFENARNLNLSFFEY